MRPRCLGRAAPVAELRRHGASPPCQFDYQPSARLLVLSLLLLLLCRIGGWAIPTGRRAWGIGFFRNIRWIGPPQLDLVLKIDSLFALNAFPDFFGKRQRIFGQRIFALGNNEIGMNRGNY